MLKNPPPLAPGLESPCPELERPPPGLESGPRPRFLNLSYVLLRGLHIGQSVF